MRSLTIALALLAGRYPREEMVWHHAPQPIRQAAYNTRTGVAAAKRSAKKRRNIRARSAKK